MDRPQSHPFGFEGKGKTQDFLSLYSHSSIQQDSKLSDGGYLRTHDFLQPLDREQKMMYKEDHMTDSNVESSSSLVNHTSVDHLLPGGIGTYSINHISFKAEAVKPASTLFNAVTNNETDDDTSNCSSNMGSGFTLCQSSLRKRKAEKENMMDTYLMIEKNKAGKWPAEKPAKSSDNHCNNFASLYSSRSLLHTNQSFTEIMKSATEILTKEEEDEDFSVKNERELMEENHDDRRASTPRSKHSATEQRRRCKINDRFRTLRELIPHGDQKRDKASFLLEVIAYIQFLQEKVDLYERSYPGRNHEQATLLGRSKSNSPTEISIEKHRVPSNIPSPLLKFGVSPDDVKNTTSLNAMRDPQEPEPAITFKVVDQQSGKVEKPNETFMKQLQLGQHRSDTLEETNELSEMLKRGLAGTVHISSMYSQALLNKLTKALQHSGVDLSQASLSVQVDVGKRARRRRFD